MTPNPTATRRRALGLCPDCGKEPEPGAVYCAACRERATARQREAREGKTVYRFRVGDEVRLWRWKPPTLHGDPVVDAHLQTVHSQLPPPGSLGEIVAVPSRSRPTYTVRFRRRRDLLQAYEEELAPHE